jgi:Family of unknown function (DUF5762)
MSWISNPSILWNKDHIYEIIPTESMTYDEKFNAITRLIIIITLLFFVFKMTLTVIFIGIICVVVLRYFYKQEGFTNVYQRALTPSPNATMPTVENPLMNVLMTEYTDDPTRKEAAPSYAPVIDKKIIESVKQQTNLDLYQNKYSNYQLDQSMRNFYTTANSTIPNKQGEFADFCYGDMISAKEGNHFALLRQHPRIGGVIN